MGRSDGACWVLGASIALPAVLTATTTWADPIVYTDRSAWETAVGGAFLEESFDDASLNPGVAFSSGWAHAGVAWGVLCDRVNDDHRQPYTLWTFDDPINAFGGSWNMWPNGWGTGITVTIPGQTWSAQIPNHYRGEFFGFVSSQAFSQVHLSEGTSVGGPYETYKFDKLVYSATTSVVPEPGALTLLGMGLAGLAAWRRRHGTAFRSRR